MGKGEVNIIGIVEKFRHSVIDRPSLPLFDRIETYTNDLNFRIHLKQ